MLFSKTRRLILSIELDDMISFQRKSGVLYLSRFGSREVVGDVTEEEVEVMDPVVEAEEGMKPVKPKLSPATFFFFFFL